MNHFNFHRFFLVLNWVVRVNWRRLVFGMAGSVAGVFIGELAIQGTWGYCDPRQLIRTYAQFWSVLMSIAVIVTVCGVTSSINEKRKREAFLMLPATNFEKFLSLVVFTAVICPLCLFLSFALGDTLRMVAFRLHGALCDTLWVTCDDKTYYWWTSAVPEVIENLTPVSEIRCDGELLLGIVSIFFLHSWFTLCGTLMRKYAFVVSNLVVIGMAMLFGYVVTRYGDSWFWLFSKTWENGAYTAYYNYLLLSIVIAVLLVLTVFCYRMSFRIFKNFQLISNKWTNV